MDPVRLVVKHTFLEFENGVEPGDREDPGRRRKSDSVLGHRRREVEEAFPNAHGSTGTAWAHGELPRDEESALSGYSSRRSSLVSEEHPHEDARRHHERASVTSIVTNNGWDAIPDAHAHLVQQSRRRSSARGAGPLGGGGSSSLSRPNRLSTQPPAPAGWYPPPLAVGPPPGGYHMQQPQHYYPPYPPPPGTNWYAPPPYRPYPAGPPPVSAASAGWGAPHYGPPPHALGYYPHGGPHPMRPPPPLSSYGAYPPAAPPDAGGGYPYRHGGGGFDFLPTPELYRGKPPWQWNYPPQPYGGSDACSSGGPQQNRSRGERSGGPIKAPLAGPRRVAHPPTKTTVMMRNVPERYFRDDLTSLLNNKGFGGKYDFVYMPMNFRTKMSFGYAFVNMVSSEAAEECQAAFQGFEDWGVETERVCEVTWSDVHQGLPSHIDRYRSSPVMHESVPDEYKPAMFSEGARIAFPPPTKKIRPPRVRRAADGGDGEGDGEGEDDGEDGDDDLHDQQP